MINLFECLNYIRSAGHSFILESTDSNNLKLSIEIKHFSHFHRFVFVAETYEELVKLIIEEDFDLEGCSFNE